MKTLSVKFKKEAPGDFYHVLRQRVNQYFEDKGLKKKATLYFKVKALSFIVAYFLLYFNLLFNVESKQGVFLSYMGMGLFMFLIFLNVVHDAAHEAIFKSRKLNLIFTWFLELFGTNNRLWRTRHLDSHHIYPNIFGWDVDIKQSPLVRIADNSPFLSFHRFQHLYMPVVYFVYTLNWLIYRDFKDITEKRLGPKVNVRYPWYQVAGMILAKITYVLYILVVPVLLLPVSFWTIFLAFLLMHFTTSFVTIFALVSSHVGENAVFPQPDEEGRLPHTWAEHQLITTADYAADNPLVTFLLGGFNLHVVHHLFPNVSHVHYPALTEILKETAAEFNIEYRSFSLGEALMSHWKLLRRNSFKENMALLEEA
ncbi:linoleoyl-CoA desaturase [Anseongella ginsenosidimutans]|uniref:Linoleoyl-CoA desaturase n=1 Tax=Anseongella ginsenosidimutans TaxID=496056 RepID=A0A4R3KTS5_9SPHI|nr:acyl-CoA desaturase [Anseongella ginsenosidimutans]TCS88360.1 linoleoyl-CoA desaturase [Anseongella ginsenosidimutans]